MFTGRGLARPLTYEPLVEIVGDLDGWLDERGIVDGQPFLISPDGRYDVALNRYFEQARMSAAPWNTQAAHARDLKNFLDFLWVNRSGRSWREAAPEDRAAYERWRRKDPRGPRVEHATWDREVATVNGFFAWAVGQGYLDASPIVQRPSRASRRWPGVGKPGTVPAESSHTGPRRHVEWLTPGMYRQWRDVGVRGFSPCGLPDPAFRGRLHTPGGLYLLVHELTRRSRAISGTESLWGVWTGRSGINGHAAPFADSLTRSLDLSRWATAQGLTADTPDGGDTGALVLRLDRLKTAAETRRAKATGGHLPSTATTNTMDVSYLHYLRNDPVIQAWAEDIIDAALADAEDSARSFQLLILGPAIHDRFRADPSATARELGTTPARLSQALAGTLDTLAASCLDIDHSPFSGGHCDVSFLTCLRCPNALVLERHLPMLYALLERLQAELGKMTVPDWCRARGVTWLIITRLILPKFSPAQREAATRGKPAAGAVAVLDLLSGPREPL